MAFICSLLLFFEYLKSFYRCKHWFVEESCRSGMQMSADDCFSLCFLPHPIQALDCSVVSQLGNIFLISAKFFLIFSRYHPRPVGETTFHMFQGECYRLENNVSCEKYSFVQGMWGPGDRTRSKGCGETLRGSKQSMSCVGVRRILGVPRQVGLGLHWASPTPEALHAPLNNLHGHLTSPGRAGVGSLTKWSHLTTSQHVLYSHRSRTTCMAEP